MELDPQVSPEEIMSRELELGCDSWTSFASGCSSTAVRDIVFVTLPSTAVETAIAQCTSRWAMAREHRLNTSIVLATVHGLSGLFRAVSAVKPSLSRHLSPVPALPPFLISNLASVDVKQHGHELSAGRVWAVVAWGLDRRMFRWLVSLCVARAGLVAPISWVWLVIGF